jgi:hypothetical protein
MIKIRIILMVAICLNFIYLPGLYCEQIIFNNSLTNESYFYSDGSFIHPSKVELINNKIPVDENQYYYPSNSLRLNWLSKSGGDWEVHLNTPMRRRSDIDFKGDTFSFWCYSEIEIDAILLPNIFLRDIKRVPVKKFKLAYVIDRLPAGQWTLIKIPLTKFEKNTREIDFSRIRSVTFTQCVDDGVEHTLYLDGFKIYDSSMTKTSDLKTPTLTTVLGFERHFDIKWEPINDKTIQNIIVYRSFDGINFKPIGIQSPKLNWYTDFINEINKKAFYKIAIIDWNDNQSEFSNIYSAETKKMDDEALLNMVQQACFRYYWDSAHSNAGMALEFVSGYEDLVATGASGFGIMAIVVAVERGFIPRKAGLNQLLKIVDFLGKADKFHGAFSHYIDGRDGKAIPLFGKYDNGGDLVETSFLIQGLLAARQYFNGNTPDEKKLYQGITKIWEGVEWDWYRREPDGNFLYWHWSPGHAWQINHPLVGWNETMITYICAIASPTHSVPPELYYSGWAGQSDKAVHYRQNWSKTTHGDHYFNGHEYYGIKLDVGEGSGGPLFFTHYSFMGLNPHEFEDKYTNYFNNSRNIALINHAYCVDNPRNFKGYGDSCWGLTASGGPFGYHPREANPKDDDGTITPTGALASFAYTPEESMKALKYFYRELGSQIWGIYGFRNAFNLTENWIAGIYLGLNQAPITVMIENYRTGLIWNLFMSNREIQECVKAIESIK